MAPAVSWADHPQPTGQSVPHPQGPPCSRGCGGNKRPMSRFRSSFEFVRSTQGADDTSDGQSGQPNRSAPITITPHGTKWIDLDELRTAATQDGGIRVTWPGNPNDLAVNAGLEDQATGYSADVHSPEHDPERSPKPARRHVAIKVRVRMLPDANAAAKRF